jgi:hypothetical protein
MDGMGIPGLQRIALLLEAPVISPVRGLFGNYWFTIRRAV